MERAEVVAIVQEEIRKSDVARLVRQLQGRYQLFTVVFPAVATGVVTMPFTLPEPWPKEHEYVFAGLTSAPGGSWGAVAAAVTSLAGGDIYMSTNPVIQTLTFSVISFGH